MKKFPEGFYFGAAVSAHQVEGGNFNDWTEWEKSHAIALAESAKERFKKLPIWKEIRKEAEDPENYLSGIAADHYRRYEEDFDIAKHIGLDSFHFSIEWSRIEPSPGAFDDEEIGHYKNYIKALRDRGLEPFLTCWHFALPVWLSDIGGILNKDFTKYFERYCSVLAASFGEDVQFWMTMNEPEIYALNAFSEANWPPEKSGPLSFVRARRALVHAHKRGYAAIKKHLPEAKVGIAVNLSDFEIANGAAINKVLHELAEKNWNHHILNAVRENLDFIGLNYYFHNRINRWFNRNLNVLTSDMGWELYPQGIKPVLLDLKKYGLPIFVTENGLADRHDKQRAWFIEKTLGHIHEAIAEGVHVRGYFHWSLLDNFEWDKGFWPKFGLIEVDRKTLKRTLRPSAESYKSIIKNSK